MTTPRTTLKTMPKTRSQLSSIITTLAGLAVALAVTGGCENLKTDPALATRAYPKELHTTESVRVQVTRVGRTLRLVNATVTSYRDFELWINQRFVRHVDQLLAGETITLRLDEFRDMYGQGVNAGGLFRTYKPTPVRLVQIQETPDQPLVGFVMIRDESGER